MVFCGYKLAHLLRFKFRSNDSCWKLPLHIQRLSIRTLCAKRKCSIQLSFSSRTAYLVASVAARTQPTPLRSSPSIEHRLRLESHRQRAHCLCAMQPWSTVRWTLIAWITVLLLDVCANAVLLLELHGWSLRWIGQAGALKTAISNFDGDVFDAACLTIVRVLLLVTLMHVGLRVGTPAWAKREQEYESARKQRAKAEAAWRKGNLQSSRSNGDRF